MDADRFWRRKGREVALRVNLGWWLSVFLPSLIVICAVFACFILIARRAEWDESLVWLALMVAVGAAAAAAYAASKKRFFTTEDGLVRLDVVHGLHNRLTSAARGVGRWPEAVAAGDGWRWSGRRIGGALALSAGLLLLAGWIPIRRDAPEARRAPGEPLAWTQVENWLDSLQTEKIAEEESIENLREQLEELRKQSPEKWYSHGSLEAGDSLRQKTEESIRALERHQELAENALNTAAEMGDRLPASELEKLDSQFKEGLKGLEMGTLPLNKEMMKQLKNVDLKNMKHMSSAQMAELRKNLREGKLACQKSLGKTGAWDKNLQQMALAAVQQSPGGGVDRGPGSVPLVLKDEQSQAGSTKVETVSNEDMSRAAMGDPLAITQSEHEVDKSLDRQAEGGAVSSAGEGGEAVWKDSLTPEERKILQRYFK